MTKIKAWATTVALTGVVLLSLGAGAMATRILGA